LQRLRHQIARRNVYILALEPGKWIFHQQADGGAHPLQLHGFLLGLRHVEAAELGFGCAGAGAEFDASVADQIERRDAFGDAGRVIDGGWRLDDAVPDAYVFGARRAGRQKHFRSRRMRVFFEKMMFGCPDVIVAAAIAQLYLLERVLDDGVIGFRVPGARKLVFEETAKFHGW